MGLPAPKVAKVPGVTYQRWPARLQGQVASPSSQRGRLRHEGVPHSKLLWSFGEYGVSYAWPLLVSTIFFTVFVPLLHRARRSVREAPPWTRGSTATDPESTARVLVLLGHDVPPIWPRARRPTLCQILKPYSDTGRTCSSIIKGSGSVKHPFPLSLAPGKPRFYVCKFGQRTTVTL